MSITASRHYPSSKRYIVNHDIMRCTADGVVGNHLYSGRALGLTEPDDYIQLNPQLKPLWRDITRHYKRIGLSHSENVIWDVDICELGLHEGFTPSVFYFGPQEASVWRDPAWVTTVEYINSKNNFMALAEELGIDVPQTRCYQSVDEIGEYEMLALNMPCYLKAAVSVSGVGIYRCANREELREAIARFDSDVPVQVQEEVKTDRFLNLQYLVVDDRLLRLAASEQILDGFAHQGNRFPAEFEPWRAVEPMARWLKARGMKGIFAFDVAVVESPDGLRFPAIECNPRFNGASYPTVIAQKLDILEWTALTFETGHRSLSAIDWRDIEYDRRTGEGVVIVNWGTLLEGKLVLLLAGSPAYQEALMSELKFRL